MNKTHKIAAMFEFLGKRGERVPLVIQYINNGEIDAIIEKHINDKNFAVQLTNLAPIALKMNRDDDIFNIVNNHLQRRWHQSYL